MIASSPERTLERGGQLASNGLPKGHRMPFLPRQPRRGGIARLIHEALAHPTDDRTPKGIRRQAHELTQGFPTYGDFEL